MIVPDTVKIMFNLDNESTNKTRSVVNNVGRALGKKKGLMFGSKDIGTINNSDIYDTYKDLYFSEKELEDKLLQDIQSAYGLKVRVGTDKTGGTVLTVTTRKMLLKSRLIKGLQYR